MKTNKDLGLLILRVLIGLSMAALHGWGKISGGPEVWTKVGGAMAIFGLDFWTTFWGFLAAIAEFFGSLLVMAGKWFRPALAMLIGTMLVAGIMHLYQGDGIGRASHAFEFAVVFIALFFTGPGKYTIMAYFKNQQAKTEV